MPYQHPSVSVASRVWQLLCLGCKFLQIFVESLPPHAKQVPNLEHEASTRPSFQEFTSPGGWGNQVNKQTSRLTQLVSGPWFDSHLLLNSLEFAVNIVNSHILKSSSAKTAYCWNLVWTPPVEGERVTWNLMAVNLARWLQACASSAVQDNCLRWRACPPSCPLRWLLLTCDCWALKMWSVQLRNRILNLTSF